MRNSATFAVALTCALSLGSACRAGPDDAALAASSYTLEVPTAPIKVKKGQAGSLRIAVVPKAGAHVSPDAPVSITLTSGPSLDLPKVKLGRADTRPTGAQGMEVALPFTGKAAGQEQLKADVVFYICIKDLCARQQKSLSFAVAIE